MKEDIYRNLVNSARDPIIVFDEADRVVYWNVAAEEEFGYSSSESYNKYLYQLIQLPDTLEQRRATDDYQELFAKQMEAVAIREDGTTFPVEISASTVVTAEQNYMAWFLRNVTNKKSSEEQIQRLSSAVEQSPGTIVITDINGNIEYCNAKFTELSGYSPQEVYGKNPRILKSGMQPADIYRDLWTTITIGEQWRGELLNRKKNGELYWEFASISPLRNPNGMITHYLKVAEDITDRKQVEQALSHAKEAAERASQAKSEFLANMSHEIRTPMNVIIGMTDYLLKSDIQQEFSDYIGMVNDSAKLLLSIINQILDFSKIEAGKLEIDKIPFRMKETIERLVKILSNSANEKGILLDLRFQEDIPDYVLGDPIRLQQVLINLIGNAIKFTDQGEIKISLKAVNKGETFVTFLVSVEDTGIGIPREKLSQLFQSFSQVDNSLARQYEGTGLGLAISKRLVELMGGTIGVESEPGIGSRFHFTAVFEQYQLPECFGNLDLLEDVSAHAELAGRRHIEKQGHLDRARIADNVKDAIQAKILLAEDKEMNQKVAKVILGNRGWQVVAVSNGREALKALEEDRYDLILMDIQMPEMDGMAVTAHIRNDEQNPNRDIPIIAMTANVLQGNQEEYFRYGMNGFVAKPFVIDDLYKTIETWLTRRTEESVKVPDGLAEGLRLLGGDKELYQEIVTIFLQEYPAELEQLELALANESSKDVGEIAHGIKGELGNLGAKEAYQLAANIEKRAKKGSLLEISGLLSELKGAIQRLENYFMSDQWQDLL